MLYFWYILQFIVGYNLVLPVLFFLVFFLFKKDKKNVKRNEAFNGDYAIIVTAYQEVNHIPDTVQSILNLKYTNFLCYVVLDNCEDISSLHFDDERVILLKPEKVLGGNVRSHFYAINNFQRAHDYLTIIDSDNLVKEDYLDELNFLFAAGYRAVQGVREAKNLDSQYACLDAARDIYYHFYDGKLLFKLGSSATLAGSGMAFETSLYKECLGGRDVSGAGFDKVLQYEIVRRNIRIAFAEDAIVYDQKTSKPNQLVNQRARWINTWFKYFNYGFKLILSGVKKFSINQLLFGLILLRPPLFMFIGVSVFFFIANFWINPYIALVWLVAFILFIISFLLPLNNRNVDKKIINALKHIPSFMFYQFISLLHVRKANKRSVATRHFEEK